MHCLFQIFGSYGKGRARDGENLSEWHSTFLPRCESSCGPCGAVKKKKDKFRCDEMIMLPNDHAPKLCLPFTNRAGIQPQQPPEQEPQAVLASCAGVWRREPEGETGTDRIHDDFNIVTSTKRVRLLSHIHIPPIFTLTTSQPIPCHCYRPGRALMRPLNTHQTQQLSTSHTHTHKLFIPSPTRDVPVGNFPSSSTCHSGIASSARVSPPPDWDPPPPACRWKLLDSPGN